MPNDLEGISTAIKEISDDVQNAFGGFSDEQLNWKPAQESWSVAQCLDHLIKSNEEFFPELESLAAGTRKNTLWQRISPLSGMAGAFLVNSLKKDNQKIKTNQKMTPPSDLGPDIVSEFQRHQNALVEKLKAANSADWRRVVLTSPFVKIMTYRMDTGLAAVIEHEKRHVRQAKRVIETEGFPK
jgi:hypothetical protein